MRSRGLTIFFLVLTGLGLYALGYRQGLHEGAAEPGRMAARPLPEVESTALMLRSESIEDFEELLSNRAWYQLERWLVANRASLEQAHGERLVRALSASINKYDAVAMRRVLRAYLERIPDDLDALFLLSDLQQIGGMREAALETLFELLNHATDAETKGIARRNADQIINVIDVELQSRGALAEREAFRRHVSQRLPGSDRFRYEWAHALAELKQWDEARRLLAETGASDIAQATIDELLERIDTAEVGLQFTRDGDRLLAAVTTPAGLQLTLLVDTGANVTSLSKTALRSLGALRLDQQARVHTAGGVVTTGVYRVAELRVQGRSFKDVRVIELPVELPALDGLLGLDILGRMSLDPLALPAS